jgi:hypothetical protein
MITPKAHLEINLSKVFSRGGYQWERDGNKEMRNDGD